MVELLLHGVVLVGAERRPLLFVLTLAAIGLGLGALWEIGEWVFDLVAAGDIIKGKQDTMIDLVVDTFGAIAAGVLMLQLRKGQWNSPLTTVSSHEGSTSSSTH